MGVARILRGWVRPGVYAGFPVRGGTMEGPKAPSEARRRRCEVKFGLNFGLRHKFGLRL